MKKRHLLLPLALATLIGCGDGTGPEIDKPDPCTCTEADKKCDDPNCLGKEPCTHTAENYKCDDPDCLGEKERCTDEQERCSEPGCIGYHPHRDFDKHCNDITCDHCSTAFPDRQRELAEELSITRAGSITSTTSLSRIVSDRLTEVFPATDWSTGPPTLEHGAWFILDTYANSVKTSQKADEPRTHTFNGSNRHSRTALPFVSYTDHDNLDFYCIAHLIPEQLLEKFDAAVKEWEAMQ